MDDLAQMISEENKGECSKNSNSITIQQKLNKWQWKFLLLKLEVRAKLVVKLARQPAVMNHKKTKCEQTKTTQFAGTFQRRAEMCSV